VLELSDLCFTINKDGEPHNLVDKVKLTLPSSHFMAIVGPSGCGKTTLLRTIAGLNTESDGSIIWNGEDLAEVGDFEPTDIGYVPQFSIAYDELTVDESIESATKLQVKTSGSDDLDARIDRVLEITGLTPLADRQVKVLSGGQKRRLGLAMELVSNPQLLLCDEVTSGLDPRSERDIVRLLHQLSRKDGRIVISVTHSLAHLELYDSILVLHEGRVAYHGPPSQVTHYFSVDDTEEIYPRLAKQKSEKWQETWLKHQPAYYDKINSRRQEKIDEGQIILPKHLAHTANPPKKSASDNIADSTPKNQSIVDADLGDELPDEEINESPERELDQTPSIFSQFFTLLGRRWKIFFRDKGQVILQVAILLCFPLLVILFAEQGDPSNLQSFPSSRPDNGAEMADHIKKVTEIGESRAKIGGAISGIVMFQVVLLALMGSNNAAREIAGEREIWEKEKFGGVSPLAYIGSKIAFLSALILVQSLWMGLFVHQFWKFPTADGVNGFTDHLMFLVLINASMTAICLAISATMKTAEQASLLSIYLVGFQLPLSGAVLALPAFARLLSSPFISAYWAWSGSIKSMPNFELQAIQSINDTPFSSYTTCLIVLGSHIVISLIVAMIGVKLHRWEH